jgi:GAF domain-containing protein
VILVASVRVAEILAGVAQGPSALSKLPDRLVRACALALPVTGVGMVLMTDEGPTGTVAATNGPAETMEELQYTLGEGPCVDSSRTGRPVLQPDLAVSGPARWPGFAVGALEAGIRAIFAFPLRVGAIRLGVLDLYRDVPGPLTAHQVTEALSFADAATTILLHLQAKDAQNPDAGLLSAIEDRAEVHQATGFVAVQAGVTLAQALLLLRARSFAAERPIGSLAHDVLAGVVRFTSDEEGCIDDG